MNQDYTSGHTTTQTKSIPSENIGRLIVYKGLKPLSRSFLVLIFSVLTVVSLYSSVHAFEYQSTISLEAVDITRKLRLPAPLSLPKVDVKGRDVTFPKATKAS